MLVLGRILRGSYMEDVTIYIQCQNSRLCTKKYDEQHSLHLRKFFEKIEKLQESHKNQEKIKEIKKFGKMKFDKIKKILENQEKFS